jgi:hypothetical protein
MLGDAAFVTASPSLRNALVAAIGAVLFVARALLEERILSEDPAYHELLRRVPYRFLPGIY